MATVYKAVVDIAVMWFAQFNVLALSYSLDIFSYSTFLSKGRLSYFSFSVLYFVETSLVYLVTNYSVVLFVYSFYKSVLYLSLEA